MRNPFLFRGKVFDVLDLPGAPASEEYLKSAYIGDPPGPRRQVVRHDPTVGIIAIDNNYNVLLVKQYRAPIGDYIVEIPAGGIEEGETPEDAAQRELQEEIGYRAERIQVLSEFYLTPGYCTEKMTLFAAWRLVPSRLHDDDTDSIELVKVPFAEFSSSTYQSQDLKTLYASALCSTDPSHLAS